MILIANWSNSLDLSHLPTPSQSNIAIHVIPAAERSLRAGHPWLFENSIQQQNREGQAGDIAVIFDKKRRFLAVGLYDPDSPIRVKVLQHKSSTTIGRDFFRERLQAAANIRAHLPAQGTIGYRLLHGENDGLPGLVIDRYGDVLVLKLYSLVWFAHLRDVLAALETVHPAETIVLRLSRTVQESETYGLSDGMVIQGKLSTSQVAFTENHLYFVADVIHGHKTGFFFDQRENRQRVRQLSSGKNVLDVFSYNGGFSLYAAAGGAKSVLSVDISEPALRDAHQLFELNANNPQVANCEHGTLVADAFDAMQQLTADGQQFELVIVDPPSFANRTLTELALRLVTKGGILVIASCSSRIAPDEFFAAIRNTASRIGYNLQEIERTSHAVDHPLRDSFPEGRYLKCLNAQVW
jgi:23S rRNA (cytosine1962-C5)-methyltransferase